MSGTPEPTDDRGDGEVLASVEDNGYVREFILADVTRDGAWIAMTAEDAPTLSDWR